MEFDGRPASLEGFNLSHCDLQERDLSRMNFRNANLSYSHLNRSNVRGADLSHACLKRAVLCAADLSNACLYEADFTGASLEGVNFSNSNIGEATLTNATYDSLTVWPENFNPPASATNIEEKFSQAVAKRYREKKDIPVVRDVSELDINPIRVAVASFVKQVTECNLSSVDHARLRSPWDSSTQDIQVCRYSPYEDQRWFIDIGTRAFEVQNSKLPYQEVECLRGWNNCVLISPEDAVEKVFLVMKSGESIELHTSICGGYRHDAWYFYDLIRSIAQVFAGAPSMRSE